MKRKQAHTFEEWYQMLITHMPKKSKGSKKYGIPDAGTKLWDKDIAEQDYNNGLTPLQCAKKFREQDEEDQYHNNCFTDEEDLFTENDFDDE